MARKTTKKSTKKTLSTRQLRVKNKRRIASTSLLPFKFKFNLVTLAFILAGISLTGYFVIRSLAATSVGPYGRASGCSSPATTAEGYKCMYESADGWSALMYIVLRNETPTKAKITYWANRIVDKRDVAAVAQDMVNSDTRPAPDGFLKLSQGSRVNAAFLRGACMNPDSTASTWSGRFKTNSNVGTAFVQFMSSYRTRAYNCHMSKIQAVAPTITLPPPPTGGNPPPPTGGNPPPPTGGNPPPPTGGNPPPVVVTPPDNPQPPDPLDPPEEPEDPGSGWQWETDAAGVQTSFGSFEGLPSLDEISLEDIEGKSDEEISQLIDEAINTDSSDKSSDGGTKERILRSYSGKIKILPPEEAIANGATEFHYYVNNKLKAKVKKSPYAYTLDTTRYKNSKYILRIVPFQGKEQLYEYKYALSIKNNLTFWQKLYNFFTAPFAG